MSLESAALTLTDDESTRIANAASTEHEPAPDLEATDRDTWSRLEALRRSLPVHLSARLAHFRAKGNEDGAVLLRNLPIDQNLGRTPTPGEPQNTYTTVSETVLRLCMAHLGEPVSYADEKKEK